MKGLIITGLSSLVFGSFFTPVNATEMMAVQSKIEPINVSMISPINLVNHARQGAFSEQGIPSHLGLSLAVKAGKVDATFLVQSAVETGHLSPESLNNSEYLRYVEFELSQLDRD